MTFIYPLLLLISCSSNSDTVGSTTISQTTSPTTQNVEQHQVQPVFTQDKVTIGENLDQGQNILHFQRTTRLGSGMRKVSSPILGGMENTVGPMYECES